MLGRALTDSGQSLSVWMNTASIAPSPVLRENLSTDVCIVGAGIAGLSTAYLLTQAGLAVAVIDDGPTAGGETGRTTAHLSNAIDDRYYRIAYLHGEEGARLAAESHTAAIDRIEAIVRQERIDCDFQRLDGYLLAGPGRPAEELEREMAAARRAGLVEVERLARAPVASFDSGPCLRFPRQGQFHPLKYLAALAARIESQGGRIYNHSHANRIEGGARARIEVDGRTVTADAVVVATNTPVNDLLAIHTKQAAYRTFVIGARIPRGSVPPALYWDTLEPYHYIRLQPGGGEEPGEHDYLIVGGEDHKTGQADDAEARYARLESWARQRFPLIREIVYRWSGQVIEPVDHLAFIGHNPADRENVYIATGDSGQGMTHGTIAGILLTDLILGRENPWARLYDPSRKTLRAAREFFRENFNVALQYADYITPGEVRSVEQIAPGQGAIVREGLLKLAVYRDDAGTLHRCSAVCPHLGCIVEWNHAEKTWDCPCHGSRFKRYGQVINGPAISGLSPEEE